MKNFHLKGLLSNTGWISPAYVRTDNSGVIISISSQPDTGYVYDSIHGYAIPGIINSHSHAFQYAMAGLAEIATSSYPADNFWNWRTKMYQLALTINPEELENIAAFLYAEMIRHGYTHVCEFHYLHHDKGGSPYNQPAEMGIRLLSAAQKAGIKITLIPIFYQLGGFGLSPLKEQRRFISANIDQYEKLWQASEQACNEFENAWIGKGIHSLRAVSPDQVIKFATEIVDAIPFHIHVAEQILEIEQAIQFLGCRPIEWLHANVDLNSNWHIVHATHMTDDETRSLANSGASVVLCPSTEGNLGDGFFNLQKFQNWGGNWSIGSDSHICLNPMEELRILDYGHRLQTHKRNSFYNSGDEEVKSAFHQIIPTGRYSSGIENGNFFKIGQPLDALIIDASHPLIATSSLPFLTPTIIYASDATMHLGTMIDGKWIVQSGRHFDKEKISASFIQSLQSLKYR